MNLQRGSGSFIKHVGTLVTGTGLAQIITLAGTLLLARLYAPSAFGLLALYVTLVSFLSVLGGGRYELAIMLPETDEEAANVLTLSLLVALAIASVCLVLVIVARHPIAALLDDTRMISWLWTVPVMLLLNDLYQSLNYWCGRMKRFRRLAYSRVLQSFGTVVGQLGLYLLHTSSGMALIGGWMFGQTLGTVVLTVQVLSGDGDFLVRSHRSRLVWNALSKYRNFPLYKAPYSFISNAAAQLVIVILRLFSTLQVVGLYSLASRAIYLPVNLIASSMNQVFYEKAATETNPERLEAFVWRALRVQILLATPILVFVVFDAKMLFGSVLGPNWSAGGSYIVSLAFAGYMYFLTSWLDRLFDVRARQKLSLVLEFAGNGASLCALSLVLYLTGNPVAAVAAFSVCEVIYSIVWLCVACHVAEFRLRALWTLAKSALVSGLVVAVLFGISHRMLHSWPWLDFALAVMLLGVCLIFSYVRYIHGGYASSSTVERFRRFWADKNTCLNHAETRDFYASQGEELRKLFRKREYNSILEIGCGEGSLFPHLHFSPSKYRGVDFSNHFLEKFRSHHPDVQLECADGATYCSEERRYDLIFSNGVIQHFDRPMLARHLANARKMMHEDSELIWGCVLDKSERWSYDLGEYSDERGSLRLLKSKLRRLLGIDPMGFWYEQREIEALAQQNGLDVRFAKSGVYPYRFHAIMRPRRIPEKQERNSHTGTTVQEHLSLPT